MTLLAPSDSFSTGDREQQQIFAEFVSDLQCFLGAEVEQVSIPDLWEQAPLEHCKGMTLYEYLSEDVRSSHGYFPVNIRLRDRLSIYISQGCHKWLYIYILAENIYLL